MVALERLRARAVQVAGAAVTLFLRMEPELLDKGFGAAPAPTPRLASLEAVAVAHLQSVAIELAPLAALAGLGQRHQSLVRL